MDKSFGIFGKYKDVFGRPGEGVHKYRFGGVAIVDYLMSIVMALIITHLTDIPFVITTICVFVGAIILHHLFGVKTGTVRYIRKNM